MDLRPRPGCFPLHEYAGGKYAGYAKLGRINEIISAAESSPRECAGRAGRLVFIRRLDRHKFSTIGLAIFPPFETFISAKPAKRANARDPRPLTRPGRGHGDSAAKISHGLAISGKIYRPKQAFKVSSGLIRVSALALALITLYVLKGSRS